MSFFENALRRSTDSSLLKEQVYTACRQFYQENGETPPEEHEIVDKFMNSDMYYDPGTQRIDGEIVDIYSHVTFTDEGERLLGSSMVRDIEAEEVEEELLHS